MPSACGSRRRLTRRLSKHGALACERIGEFVELGTTVVLAAMDPDAAGMRAKMVSEGKSLLGGLDRRWRALAASEPQ